MSLPPDPVTLAPWDEHNRTLLANVHPAEWENPEPVSRYDLVVIGAGTAGLVAAAGAAGLGAKVALVEKYLLGGDCLNTGCIPSKAIIRSSRVAAEIRAAGKFGVRVPADVEVDFAAVMARMRELRARLSHHDSVKRFQNLGVDVFLGAARFANPNTVLVGHRALSYKKAVIATGARAVDPGMEGLAEAGYLTHETVFTLTERPRRLAVIGGGPVGCELAQAFQRLGSEVVLLHKHGHLLDREDPEASAILQKVFVRAGIDLRLNCRLNKVRRTTHGKSIYLQTEGEERCIEVDEILAGTGRLPNVEDLNLRSVGVEYDLHQGVVVNDHLQTTNPHVYAAGDVCTKWKFTHAADAAARIVIQNSLFLGRKKFSALIIPRCTYTDPEIAHIGLVEREARENGFAVDTFSRPFYEVDRAIIDGHEEGFVKVIVSKGKDKILGATIVAPHAGEMIGEISLAMAAKIGLGKIASVIHPYPTQAESIKHVADAYQRSRLTPGLKKILERWLAWSR